MRPAPDLGRSLNPGKTRRFLLDPTCPPDVNSRVQRNAYANCYCRGSQGGGQGVGEAISGARRKDDRNTKPGGRFFATDVASTAEGSQIMQLLYRARPPT